MLAVNAVWSLWYVDIIKMVLMLLNINYYQLFQS
jgi:ferric iron reductase protein FhuF